MKLLFEEEDCVFGILVGLVLIGLSGKFIHLPKISFLYGIIFGFSLVLSFLDLASLFTRLHHHFAITALNIANNAIDIVLELLFIAYFFSFKIPFLTPFLEPLATTPAALFYIGIFFLATNIFWVIIGFFIQ